MEPEKSSDHSPSPQSEISIPPDQSTPETVAHSNKLVLRLISLALVIVIGVFIYLIILKIK